MRRQERRLRVDAQMTLSPSTVLGTKEPTALSEEFLTAVGHQLRKLGRMFRRELDEVEVLTYMEQLRDLKPDLIELACTKALQKLKRMPTIADIREMANEPSDIPAPRPDRKHCVRCYPDGYRLETHPFLGAPYKVAVRCECQDAKP